MGIWASRKCSKIIIHHENTGEYLNFPMLFILNFRLVSTHAFTLSLSLSLSFTFFRPTVFISLYSPNIFLYIWAWTVTHKWIYVKYQFHWDGKCHFWKRAKVFPLCMEHMWSVYLCSAHMNFAFTFLHSEWTNYEQLHFIYVLISCFGSWKNDFNALHTIYIFI